MSRIIWNSITDCPYAAKILILIYEKGMIKRSDIREVVQGGAGIHRQALEFLEEKGYLTIEDIKIPHITSKITLTAKGARTARRFIEIENDTPEDDHISHTSGERVCYEDKSSKEE